MAKIFIAGLNPAWQQIFPLVHLHAGEVNRAQAYSELASGKGMNAAKILASRGHEVSLWHVLAGGNGERVQADCERRGIRSLHAYTAGNTRVCATLLHDHTATEVIAPFSVAGDATLANRLLAAVPDERFDAILVCGTVPAGLDEAVLAAARARVLASSSAASSTSAAVASASPVLTIWDSVAGLAPDTLSAADWLKVNAEEYRALSLRAPSLAPVQPSPSSSSSSSSSASGPSLLVTDGARPALVKTPGGSPVSCVVPRLPAVINPIGAGDTATAMLADGLLGGLDARVAAGRALAAAAASCLNRLPAVWDETDAARIEAGLRWLAPGEHA